MTGWGPATSLGRRQWGAVGLLAVATVAALLLPRVAVDNSLERWVGTDPEQAAGYARFRETFGSDEFVLVAVDGQPLFEPVILAAMVDATDRLEGIHGVLQVGGIPEVFRDRFGGEDREAFRDEVTSNPFYRGLFISPDSGMAGILVEVEPQAGPAGRRDLAEGIRRAVRPLEEVGLRVLLVGSTVLIDALDRLSVAEASRTLPVALLCSLAMLAMVLRSARGVAVAATCSGVTVAVTLGLAVATGRTLNMLTAALPALLWVLSLGNTVHLLQRYRSHRRDLELRPAVERAVREVTRPATLSCVTTMVGFLSLGVTEMAPVRELGLLAAAGVLVALVATLTLGPSLILWWRPPAAPHRSTLNTVAKAARSLPLERPRGVVAVGWAVLLLALACLPLLQVRSNPLGFLPERHPVVQAYGEVGGRLTGFYTMEVVVDTTAPWWEPSVASRLAALEAAIGSSPLVARVVSPLDVLRQLNHWEHGLDPAFYRLPDTGAEAEGLLGTLDERGRRQLDGLATRSGTTVRLSAVVREMDEHRFLGLVGATREALMALPAGWGSLVTGQVLRLVQAQQRLVTTQLESLAVAFVLVFATIGIGLRSWRLMLSAVLPNVLPFASAFTVMSLTGLPLDPATVMVASVALGIAVDNTVHQLEVFRGHREGGLPVVEAIVATRTDVAPAMVTTAVTACAGFLALCLSSFLPIRSFGLLSATAVLVALVADTLLVPAKLLILARRDG